MTVADTIATAVRLVDRTRWAHVDPHDVLDEKLNPPAFSHAEDDDERFSTYICVYPPLHWTLTGDAELVSVSDAMVDLTCVAAETLPLDMVVSSDDLPWPVGFAVLDRGVVGNVCNDPGCLGSHSHLARYLAWWAGGDHIYASWYGEHPDGGLHPSMSVVHRNGETFGDNLPPAVAPDDDLTVEEAAAISDAQERGYRFVVAFWSLIQQRITDVTLADPSRAERRRLQREFGRVPSMRIVNLRQPRTLSEPGGGESREWSHRWIVGGHWRNQWCPASSTHRPTWIAPYVKGPEDKPLVTTPRAFRWSR